MRQEAGQLESTVTKTYLEKAKQFGEAWQRFVSENEDLLRRIFAALADLERYQLLKDAYNQLRKSGQLEAANAFAKRSDMDQLGIAGWDVLNPLLAEVDKVMAEYGVDAKQFFG